MSKRLIDLLKLIGPNWSMNSPTRVRTISVTAIDNVIKHLTNAEVSAVNTAISDHYGQQVTISGHEAARDPANKKLSETQQQEARRATDLGAYEHLPSQIGGQQFAKFNQKCSNDHTIQNSSENCVDCKSILQHRRVLDISMGVLRIGRLTSC
ncbi:hypothetical protein J6590_060143 [Homalodisca vitripennis]|nr:hypothetical protein J6590_060143 [Homalodisca vitripennis]